MPPLYSGTAPEDAEIQFLQKVKWLDRYGVHLFEVHVSYSISSLSTVVLNSRDHYENIWLPEFFCTFKNNLTTGFS